MPTLWDKIEAKFNELKTSLTAGNASAADHSKTISDFRAEIESAKSASAKDLEARDKSISDLTAKNEQLVKDVAARDGEITKLKGEAKTAGERAADVVAATGIDPAQLPAATNKGGGADQKEKLTLRQQYFALLKSDHIKAAEFYAKHFDKPEFWQ